MFMIFGPEIIIFDDFGRGGPEIYPRYIGDISGELWGHLGGVTVIGDFFGLKNSAVVRKSAFPEPI